MGPCMVEELLSNKKYRTVRVSEPLVKSSPTKRLWLSLSEHVAIGRDSFF